MSWGFSIFHAACSHCSVTELFYCYYKSDALSSQRCASFDDFRMGRRRRECNPQYILRSMSSVVPNSFKLTARIIQFSGCLLRNVSFWFSRWQVKIQKMKEVSGKRRNHDYDYNNVTFNDLDGSGPVEDSIPMRIWLHYLKFWILFHIYCPRRVKLTK
jgi:hypothetical protein